MDRDVPPEVGREAASARCLQRIGLAVRARRAAVGSDAALAAIRRREAKLVVLAADAGGNARKKYSDKCAFYHIPLLEAFDRDSLGRACGRSQAAVVAVTDPGFAASVMACVGEYRGGEAFDETSGV
ncbi:MAG: ribosomal L7Ae/L30e/S12e/Gadd45 family protein [Alicyclobacillaceae bacterium]|nr:ribosomal L7Ae/L30e/S12e/Gadd45 family protein [Alicyclobacillaceae bacterium]